MPLLLAMLPAYDNHQAMIKFFRNIRQNMLKESRFSKYLVYAIGEILLVVIGILIALQINNWNEHRKESREEFKILNQLYNDFVQDSSTLKVFTRLSRNKVADGKLLKRIIMEQDTMVERDTIINKAFYLGFAVFFNNYSPTYDEIVSSGKLALIKNDRIRASIRLFDQVQILERESFRDNAIRQKEEYNEHLSRYFEPEAKIYFFNENNSIDNSIRLDQFRIDLPGFLNDPETIMQIEKMIGIESSFQWTYENRTMQRLTNIINSLKMEIQKFNV